MSVALDTSFLAHALVRLQMTAAAVREFERLESSDDPVLVWESSFVEFKSFIRKSITRRHLTSREGTEIVRRLRFASRIVHATDDLLERGFELATRLGQSDTFDATGYVLAVANGADFWVSDRRFANAAFAARLPRIHYVA